MIGRSLVNNTRVKTHQGVDKYLNEDHDTDTVEACEEEGLGEGPENLHGSQAVE